MTSAVLNRTGGNIKIFVRKLGGDILNKNKIVIVTAALLSGCVVEQPRVVYVPAPPPPVVYQAPPQVVYQAPEPQPVVSIYVEPPLFQPPPIRVAWAPPPMLVEIPSPMPYDGAIWTGGYWVWEGDWVWAHGRWAPPPRPGYGWVNPYYENRGGSVVFINGFWAAPGVSFVAPSLSVNIAFGVVAVGVIAGPRPMGPEGVFVPPPPGSHFGLIVPAPIGTAPAVVTGAPPIVRGGMRINSNNNNSTQINNVTNVTNITNVTIVAPASATANGQAVNTSVPAQPHLAAAMPPVVKAYAPIPASTKPIPAYVPGRPPVTLPQAQMVHSEVTPALMHPHAVEQLRPAAPVAPPVQARPAAMPAYAAPVQPAAVPNQGNQNQAKPNMAQPGPRAPQEGLNHAPQQPINAATNQGVPKQPPKAVAPVKKEQQKPNGDAQKKKEAKKPKEEGKPSEKHEERN
jgi:hypothetical protein